jgi:hypothetical protein
MVFSKDYFEIINKRINYPQVISFPDNSKQHVDYVLYLESIKSKNESLKNKLSNLISKIFLKFNLNDNDEKYNADIERNRICNEFLKQLNENENIDYRIVKDTDRNDYYILLNVKDERMLIEIEKLKLHISISLKKLEEKTSKVSKSDKKTIDYLNDFISNQIQKQNQFGCINLFSILDDTNTKVLINLSEKYLNSKKDYFANPIERPTSMRSFIIDNILNNFQFRHKDNEQPGLSFMLKNKYFDDAFILHNPIVLEVENNNKLTKLTTKKYNDVREGLKFEWTNLNNMIKRKQPLNMIRNYFGEEITFYFAWTVHFLFHLIIPSIIGIIFFMIGIIRA